VLLVSPHDRVQYFTGTFDPDAGKFTPQKQGLMDYSSHYYAAQLPGRPARPAVLWGWIKDSRRAGMEWVLDPGTHPHAGRRRPFAASARA